MMFRDTPRSKTATKEGNTANAKKADFFAGVARQPSCDASSDASSPCRGLLHWVRRLCSALSVRGLPTYEERAKTPKAANQRWLSGKKTMSSNNAKNTKEKMSESIELFLSFPRKRESSYFFIVWISAFAEMTSFKPESQSYHLSRLKSPMIFLSPRFPIFFPKEGLEYTCQ